MHPVGSLDRLEKLRKFQRLIESKGVATQPSAEPTRLPQNMMRQGARLALFWGFTDLSLSVLWFSPDIADKVDRITTCLTLPK